MAHTNRLCAVLEARAVAAPADSRVMDDFDTLMTRMADVEDGLGRLTSAVDAHTKCTRLEDNFGPRKTCPGLRYGLAANHRIEKLYDGAPRAGDVIVVTVDSRTASALDGAFDDVIKWLTTPIPVEVLPEGSEGSDGDSVVPSLTADDIITALGGQHRAMDIRNRFRVKHLENCDVEQQPVNASSRWMDGEVCMYVNIAEDIDSAFART